MAGAVSASAARGVPRPARGRRSPDGASPPGKSLQRCPAAVNLPLESLPGRLAAAGGALPLTHGNQAVRATSAYALLRPFEAEGGRRSSLETT